MNRSNGAGSMSHNSSPPPLERSETDASGGTGASRSQSSSDDAVLKLFNDKELSNTTVKLKNPRKPTQKKPTNWKERAKQLESQGSTPSPPRLPPATKLTFFCAAQ
jgi:hypothetical protein